MQSSCVVNRLDFSSSFMCDTCTTPSKTLYSIEFPAKRLEVCISCYIALKAGMREMIGRSYNPIPDPAVQRVAPCNSEGKCILCSQVKKGAGRHPYDDFICDDCYNNVRDTLQRRDVAQPRDQQVAVCVRGSVDRALDEEYEKWISEHPEGV